MSSPTAIDALGRFADRVAVVTIDLHRGHLDPTVATLPLEADRAAAVTAASVGFVDAVRPLGVPIIHVITSYRDTAEILSNPFWSYQADRPDSSRKRIAEHNLEGLPGLELMPGLMGPGDLVVDTKKRYDCFLGTDLDITLRSHGISTVILLGVNTNSCVMATAAAASVRDYAVFIVTEGVDTMLDRSFHDAALSVLDASFGWSIDAADCIAVLADRAPDRGASRGSDVPGDQQ